MSTQQQPQQQQQQQQQPPQQPSPYSFLKIPQILYDQWIPAEDIPDPNDLNPPKPPTRQVGFIELIEYPDGKKEEFYVLVDPTTNEEIKVPMKQLKQPSAPFLLFTPVQVEGQEATQHQFNTQLFEFKDIHFPFHLHQQLVSIQQRSNDEQRANRQMGVLTDINRQIALETEVDLSAFYEQHRLQQQETKEKSRNFRESDEEIIRMVFELFKVRPDGATMDEIVGYTRQPKAPLQAILSQYCDKITTGPNRGKYRLKSRGGA